MNMIHKILILTLAFASVATPLAAQQPNRGMPEGMREKIEDLRKVKLLDVLDLEGDQVERFFTVYNRYSKEMHDLRLAIDKSSRKLQSAVSNDEDDATVSRQTKDLRKKIKDMGDLIDKRFEDVQPILSTQQFAQYVVFEARFRDELQRMILDRMRRRGRR